MAHLSASRKIDGPTGGCLADGNAGCLVCPRPRLGISVASAGGKIAQWRGVPQLGGGRRVVPFLGHMLYRLLGLRPPRERASIVLLRCGGCHVVLDWVTFAGVVFSGRHMTAAGQPTRAGPCFLFLRQLRQVPFVALFVLGLPCSFLVIICHYLQGLFYEVIRASLRPPSNICLFTTYNTYTSFCSIWFFP